MIYQYMIYKKLLKIRYYAVNQDYRRMALYLQLYRYKNVKLKN